MIGLIDFDSVLYKAVYKIVSFSQMREAIELYGKEKAKDWLLQEVYHEGVNRTENMLLTMQTDAQSIFDKEVLSWELYITTCSNNFRKALTPEYKKTRKRNSYVWLLREHYRMNGAFHSETLEADDLMADRSVELGLGNSLILSIDKDLKTVSGYYWSYYKIRSRDINNDYIVNEFGHYETEYKQNEILFISEEDAELNLYTQMIKGDTSDNISGIKGIGAVGAKKILGTAKNRFIATAREYIKRDLKDEFRINYKLLKLGKPNEGRN
mgnify:FL=1